jgi:uncharacterized protein DUF4252
MKTHFIKVLTIIILLLPATTFAQSKIDKLYKKYAGKEGFTSMNISPEMFSLLGNFDMNDSSEDAKDAQNIMQQLEGLKMLVYENPEGNSVNEFYKEIKNTLPLDEYAELMVINDSDSDIKFLIKKSAKDRISELLMIVKSEDEVLIMSMVGDLDMNTISDISHSLDMKGMENLEKIND